MLDRLFFIALVLNTSGLFRFVAPNIGVAIGDVTLALLVLNCFYLAARAPIALDTLFRGAVGRWLLLFLLWPFATIVYAPSLEIREVALNIYFFSLFLGTVVYIRMNGLPAMYRMLTISLVLTIIGMPLSILAPQFFEAAASLADARSEHLGRPVGFFLQPNRLAICLVWICVAWYGLFQKKSTYSDVLAIIGFIGLQLLTGSRAGVLVSAGVVAIMLAYNWPRRLFRGRLVYTGLLVLLCAAVGLAGLRIYLGTASEASGRKHGDLIDRIDSMVSLQFSPEGSIQEDTSLQKRFDTQAQYLDSVMQKPLLGRGFGSNVHFLDTGRITLSAHSEALTRAFEYGLLYPIAMWLAVGSLYLRRGRKSVQRALGTNTLAQFAGAYMVIFAYSSVMEEGRVFSIVLGLMYAVVQYRASLFHRDEETGELGKPFSRREIRARLRPKPAPDSASDSVAGASTQANEECTP